MVAISNARFPGVVRSLAALSLGAMGLGLIGWLLASQWSVEAANWFVLACVLCFAANAGLLVWDTLLSVSGSRATRSGLLLTLVGMFLRISIPLAACLGVVITRGPDAGRVFALCLLIAYPAMLLIATWIVTTGNRSRRESPVRAA